VSDRPRPLESRAMTARKLQPVEDAGEGGPSGEPALSRIRLTADRLLVRAPGDAERRSKAGLLIPATAAIHNKRGVWSQVVMTGPEVRTVRAGDHVLFILQSALEVDVDAESYLLLRERDIQAISSDQTDVQTGQYL
jgi:chaperonin GroES